MKILCGSYHQDGVNSKHIRQQTPRIAHGTFFRGCGQWKFLDKADYWSIGNMPGAPPHFASRFEEFLDWSSKLPKDDDPDAREEGRIAVKRLVIGLFPFGRAFGVIAVKFNIRLRTSSTGHKSMIITVIETFSGIGCVLDSSLSQYQTQRLTPPSGDPVMQSSHRYKPP